MERKYYLRGLGLGIAMTAVIMGIALSGSHKMTDAEVIKRAKELGMVEDTYLTDAAAGEQSVQTEQNIEDDPSESGMIPEAEPDSESPQAEEADTSGETESAGPEEEALPVAEPVETEPVEVKAASEENRQSASAEPLENTNEMTRQEDAPSSSVKVAKVTIVSGDGSYAVSLKLKEAGVVMSAETFDDFLCERGYDKRLRTGTFQIPSDASDEQIARIVTGQE